MNDCGPRCRNPGLCEILGCLDAPPGAIGPVVRAALPDVQDEPAELAELGRFERWVVRATDRLCGLRPTALPSPAPAPSAPAAQELTMDILPTSLPPEAEAPQERRLQATVTNTVNPFAPAAAPALAARKARDLRIVTVPAGGFAVIEDNALVAIGMDALQIGAAVTGLLRA